MEDKGSMAFFPPADSLAARVRSCAVRRPAGDRWQDGLLLGNGDLGAVAYADEHLEWVVNKTDLFDANYDKADYLTHREFLKDIDSMPLKNTLFLSREQANVSEDFLKHTISAVRLRIRFWEWGGWGAPALPNYSQCLSLHDGELTETVDAPYLQAEVESFIPRESSVLCLRIRKLSRQTENCHAIILELQRPDDERLDEPAWQAEDGILSFTQPLPEGNGSYAVALAVPGQAGSQRTWRHVGRLFLDKDNDAFLAVRTSRACQNPLAAARDAVRRAVAESFGGLRGRNREWWHGFWQASYAEFASEPELTRQWMFSLYTLGATFGKSPIPGLNGLSYGPDDPLNAGLSFQSYTQDQNVQIPIMPLGMCNHAELASVLADTYLDVLPVMKQQTRDHFGVDGVFLPNNMNQDGRELPIGPYRYTLCDAAYSGLVLALTWRYCRDRRQLADKIYPLLREFISFYLGIMHKGDDGCYHMDWSVPPEIFTLTRDDTASLAMLRTCMETAVEATEILGIDAEFRACLQEVLAHYPPLAKRPGGGWWGGPDIPLDHYCYGGHQMYPFFPSEAYLDEDAIRKTLDALPDVAIEISQMTPEPHPMHEWSAFLLTAVRSRLGRRDEAWRGLHDFLTGFRKPNGLFAHNPVWVIDTAASLAAHAHGRRNRLRQPDGSYADSTGWSEDVTPNPDALRRIPPILEGSAAFLFLATETLLQSWGGVVRLFPTVPEGFSGSFLLRAQGGFLVAATMEQGRVTAVRVQACEKRTLRLVCCDGTAREFTAAMTPGEIWTLPA